MIKSGYDLMDLSDKIVSDVCTQIGEMDLGNDIVNYFLFTKTYMISVNPYCPRGSDLSAACFFLDTDFGKYINFLHLCESPEADNSEFIAWTATLPDILKIIENHKSFEKVYQFYRFEVEKRFSHLSDQMVGLEDCLKSTPFYSETDLVFAPNLLQAKFLADYALKDNTLFVISGVFKSSAIIHEYLHIVMKPVRHVLINVIQKYGIEKFVDVKCMLELGYMRGETDKDKAHTLDECIVRALCGVIDKSLDLHEYCHENVKWGFLSVPKMIEQLSSDLWASMALEQIVLKATNFSE